MLLFYGEMGRTWPCMWSFNGCHPTRSCWWERPAAWQSEAGRVGSSPVLARWYSCSSGSCCERCLLEVDGSRANEEGQVCISLAVNRAGEAVKTMLALMRNISRAELSPAVAVCWLCSVFQARGRRAQHQCQCQGL